MWRRRPDFQDSYVTGTRGLDTLPSIVSRKTVIPANAGIYAESSSLLSMDSRLRGNDGFSANDDLEFDHGISSDASGATNGSLGGSGSIERTS
jgi:hypothetical protein